MALFKKKKPLTTKEMGQETSKYIAQQQEQAKMLRALKEREKAQQRLAKTQEEIKQRKPSRLRKFQQGFEKFQTGTQRFAGGVQKFQKGMATTSASFLPKETKTRKQNGFMGMGSTGGIAPSGIIGGFGQPQPRLTRTKKKRKTKKKPKYIIRSGKAYQVA